MFEVIEMSLIACLSRCVYQQDGYCALERAASAGAPNNIETCIHYIPCAESLQNGGQRLANIIDAN